LFGSSLARSNQQPASSYRRLVAPFAWAVLLSFFWLIALGAALESAYHFAGPAIDGPFQLYNALRRIADGQRGGVDFQFFHGLGIPYLHYPVYRALGGTFFASEIARQLVSPALYLATTVAFTRAFTTTWSRAVRLATIVIGVSTLTPIVWRFVDVSNLLSPTNSLLGVRTTLPLLFVVTLVAPLRAPWRTVLAGVVLGAALVCSTEQGLAIVAAFVTVSTVDIAVSESRRARATAFAIPLGVTVMTVLVLLTLMGGLSGARGALSYNFRVVPMDQYWYFGAPPNRFLVGWGSLVRQLADIPRIPLTVLAAVVAGGVELRRLVRTPDAGRVRHVALATLAVYGVFSCGSLLGTFTPAYVQPCARVLLLMVILEADRWLSVWSADRERLPHFVARVVWPSTAAALVLLIPGRQLATAWHVATAHVIGDAPAAFSSIWPQTLIRGQRVVAAHRGPRGEPPTLWSTYAGLLEARNGVFQPASDYVIHALGPALRARYIDEFRARRPALVQTVLPKYTRYEMWIEQTTWAMYADLLDRYRVVDSTPWSLFWERRPQPKTPRAVWFEQSLPAGASNVTFPQVPAGTALLEVELSYRVHNPLHALPIFGSLPRYLVRGTDMFNRNPVTLDPYVTSARFPLLVRPGVAPTLFVQVASLLPGARIELTGVRVWQISIDADNAAWFDSLLDQQVNGP
jgi:hypothetical protein